MYHMIKVNYKLTWGGGVLTNLRKRLTFFYRGTKID